MPTSPSLPAVLPPAPVSEQPLPIVLVALQHLPHRFVELLDHLVGKFKDDNGGFGHIGFDVKRGQPGMLVASETYKEESWLES